MLKQTISLGCQPSTLRHHSGSVLRLASHALLFVGLTSCLPEATLCPQWENPPILVAVRDGSTGSPAAQGAGGWIQDGDFVSPLMPAAPNEPLILASSGGPGVYDVVVQKSGYTTWIKRTVYVAGGSCGVNKSIQLNADLQPST